MIVKPKRNTIINFHCKDTKCMVSLTPQQKYKAYISMEKYQVELVHHNFYITLLTMSTLSISEKNQRKEVHDL